jgi:excinuclease ABC subunit A
MNIAEIASMKISDARKFVDNIELTEYEREKSELIRGQLRSRLEYLEAVGLGYLALDRTLRTLSGGEAQRVSLTTALGSSLVNMLYVLDEPTVGLHPQDVDRLSESIQGLCRRGNTVVVVEHEESMLRIADQLVEIGPGAGDRGGRVVFQGDLEAMQQPDASLTGEYLCGRRGVSSRPQRREPNRGWIRLSGARGNNLKNLTVKFPLGVLCLVTGVSGAGKSTLVQDTLYGALCRRKKKEASKPLRFDDVVGDGQIDEVVLVDQSPIGRSPRSNPVTYIKAFDPIRAVFAETVEARTHNYAAGHFSFNVDGGRCSVCKGDGHIEIDMQFLADVYMKCSQCHGTRYRKEILAVKYRNKNIADVLNMTVREAFSFFRGQSKVQVKLKQLMDVGLDYLRLGQPANTLSSGESQRLKLAAHMSAAKRRRTLFILDEPTTGLHFSDIVQLLDCFDALLSVGHSLIVVEHNLQLMKAADYIIDLGPGAADEGGELVAEGEPEEVAQVEQSVTGRFLQEALKRDLLYLEVRG